MESRKASTIEATTSLAEREREELNGQPPPTQGSGRSPISSASEAAHSADPTTSGLLRVLVLFHESEALGAGVSVMRVVKDLGKYGWAASGWFPGDGPLIETASDVLRSTRQAARPIAVSRRGWREPPGVGERIRRTPAYLGTVRRALREIRPHVVHANTLHALPEALVARQCGLPVVLQCHELPEPSVKREATIFAAARVADVLVGVSEAVCTMLRRYAWSTPVQAVFNGVPRIPDAADRDRPFIVGSVGTISRVKGTDIFLRAARHTRAIQPDIVFEHVGSPDLHRDRGLREELDELMAGEGLRDGGVSMLGSIPARTVVPNWSVFVAPSRSDGFPLATLEAMAAGVPVIACGVGGIPEQIEHLVSGILVRPNDPEAISSWIVRLHADSTLRRRLGAEGRRRVQETFTVARQAEGLHRAYLTALNLRFGPAPVRAATVRSM